MTLISLRNRSAPQHFAEFGLQDFDGDLAIVLEVVREIHGGHAAGAEFTLDAVPIEQRGSKRTFGRDRVVSGAVFGQAAMTTLW